MDTQCHIALFGPLRVMRGQEVVTRFPTQKAGILLAYLALTGKPQTREHLMDLLWPELEPDAGRNNLSTLLSLLRRVLEPRPTPAGTMLVADRQSVGLNPATVTTDVSAFDRLRRQAKKADDTEARLKLLAEAGELAREELLPGLYDDWAISARDRYTEQRAEIRREQARLLLESGRAGDALPILADALQLDACDEESARLEMQILAEQGRCGAALQTFARLEQALADRLGATPEPESRRLRDRLSSLNEGKSEQATGNTGNTGRNTGRGKEGETNAGRMSEPETAETPEYRNARTPERLNAAAPQIENLSLPLSLTRFFGRERETAWLHDWLREPQNRLATILGAGGAGKTRLATEAARQAAPCFGGRVWFVPLADVPVPALIPLTLRDALNLPASPGDPLEQAAAFLADKPALLVLDNLEHLLAPPDAVSKSENPLAVGAQAVIRRLLAKAPLLVCLATSRQALNLDGEQILTLPPLELPSCPDDATGSADSVRDNASVALYVDRAQKAKADFILTDRNAQAIAELCRRLEGLPLAIEMAAAWVKTIPPGRMLERMTRQLDLLVSRRSDLPARQQSLRAVCEWSRELLTPEQREAWARLSVFRGGWTLDAADALLGGDALFLLAELQERSLIVASESGTANNGSGAAERATADSDDGAETESRYAMLEPLREFGLEMLGESGDSLTAFSAHADWFAESSRQAQFDWRGPNESERVRALRREQSNLRAALRWLTDHDERRGVAMGANLARFWEVTGGLREGTQTLAELLAKSSTPDAAPERVPALNGAGMLAMLQTDYAQARTWHEEARTLAQKQNDRAGEAAALHGLANAVYYEQEYAQAQAWYEESLKLRRATGDEVGIAACCHSLGNIQLRYDNPEAARAWFREAAHIRRKCGDRIGAASTLGALGQIALAEEQTAEALACFREILQIFHDEGVAWAVALTLHNVAQVRRAQDETPLAVTLFGAAQAQRDRACFPLPPAERESHEERLAELRGRIGDAAFELAWAEGRVMNEAQAVRFALADSLPPA